MLGAGPGATNPSFAKEFSGQVYKDHMHLWTWRQVFWTQFSSSIVDWGYGFAVFLGLYCAVFIVNAQFYNQCEDLLRSVSLSLTGLIVSCYHPSSIRKDGNRCVTFSIWFTFAMIVTKIKRTEGVLQISGST